MKHLSEATSAHRSGVERVESALRIFEGRWKFAILSHLFAQPVVRFSDLSLLIPTLSQKMLSQRLRELERDGIIGRTVYPVVPPKVEYWLTEDGKALCPAIQALLGWAALREAKAGRGTSDEPYSESADGRETGYEAIASATTRATKIPVP